MIIAQRHYVLSVVYIAIDVKGVNRGEGVGVGWVGHHTDDEIIRMASAAIPRAKYILVVDSESERPPVDAAIRGVYLRQHRILVLNSLCIEVEGVVINVVLGVFDNVWVGFSVNGVFYAVPARRHVVDAVAGLDTREVE